MEWVFDTVMGYNGFRLLKVAVVRDGWVLETGWFDANNIDYFVGCLRYLRIHKV